MLTHFDRLHARLRDPLLTVLTLLLSVLLFVIGPMQAAGAVTGQHFGYFFGLVLLPAVFLYSRNFLVAAPIAVAIGLVVAAALMDVDWSPRTDLYLDSSAWLIAGLVLSIVVARAVFWPGRITYHRVVGAVLLYLIIGLTFVAFYGFVALAVPNAFTNISTHHGDFAIAGNLIYFSFATLTTTGYGDIAPLHPYARSLANIEAIIGQIYPATLLARLVTLELAHERGV
ncbi:ion channel [Bradyrhizobium sp. STM 3562]|uniref:ion channel n=1 Tax=Bradyrhizobium sp. STM 3562 TaxID=578924 RepID=UPI00388F78FF